MDGTWENRVSRCHDPLFNHLTDTPPPSPLFPIEEEDVDDRIEDDLEVSDEEDGENDSMEGKNDDKVSEKPEEKVKPKKDDINIFCYHPHIALKSGVVKTIKSNSDSAESGAESELSSAESKQGDINTESVINIDVSGQGENEKDANVKKDWNIVTQRKE